MSNEPHPSDPIARAIRLALIWSICLVAIATAITLATDIFLILFLSGLFGVFLSRLSRLLARVTPATYALSLGIVTSTLLLLIGGCAALFGTQIHGEIKKASENIDEGVEQLQDFADDYPSFKSILLSTPFVRELIEKNESGSRLQSHQQKQESDKQNANDSQNGESENESKQDAKVQGVKKQGEGQMNAVEQGALRDSARRVASAAAGVFKTTFGLIVNSALIFFVGLFLAISPGEYRDGVVTLFPPARRDRVCEILNKLGDSLWHWLIGRFGSMLITGAGAGLLLLVLGVPMAVTLGVVTALLTFIPNIGSAVALVLAILLALPSGETTVLLVIAGYIGLQLIESYIVTPLIQQQQVSLPPALLIATQAVMGVLFGFLGATVASPMLAVAKVAVEEAYVKDVLEQPTAES